MSPVSTYSFRAAFSLGGWDSMKLQSASLLLISLASSSNLLHLSALSIAFRRCGRSIKAGA